MEKRDLIFIAFWSAVLAMASYFIVSGKFALTLLSLSFVGLAFLEKGVHGKYIAAAISIAFVLAVYMLADFRLEGPLPAQTVLAAVFLAAPFALHEIRKRVYGKEHHAAHHAHAHAHDQAHHGSEQHKQQ